MYLGLYTDSVSSLSLEQAIELADRLGLRGLEIAVGGQSAAPHLDLEELHRDRSAADAFAQRIEDAGLHIAALNCSAWPFHPVDGEQQLDIMRRGIDLAQRWGVATVVTMSGTPGDGDSASIPAWTWYPWPPEIVALRQAQWARITPTWEALAAYAESRGVTRLALEMHPMHLVYNAPTLLRLREQVGPVIGANLDPSHLLWQQADPAAVASALGDAVHHVHLKDIGFNPEILARVGVLDSSSFDWPDDRPWNFATVGQGHGEELWRPFLDALHAAGYDGLLSIENEDPYRPQVEGVEMAASFMSRILQAALAEWPELG